jgi:hypothetical protein
MEKTGHCPRLFRNGKINYPGRFQTLSEGLRKENAYIYRDSNPDSRPSQSEAGSNVSVPYWH